MSAWPDQDILHALPGLDDHSWIADKAIRIRFNGWTVPNKLADLKESEV